VIVIYVLRRADHVVGLGSPIGDQTVLSQVTSMVFRPRPGFVEGWTVP